MNIPQQQIILQEIAQAIKTIKYGDTISVRITPTNMTSNDTPVPFIASASSTYDENASRQAFNAFAPIISSNGWLAAPWGTMDGIHCKKHATSGNDWIQIKLDKQYVANKLVLYNRNNNPGMMPKDFYLSGSNDGINWETLLNVQNNPFNNTPGYSQSWNFVNIYPFQYYRVTITGMPVTANLDYGCRVGLGRIELYEIQNEIAPQLQGNNFATELAAISTRYSAGYYVPNMSRQSLRAKFRKLAEIIRIKTGTTKIIKPSEMATYILQIEPQ